MNRSQDTDTKVKSSLGRRRKRKDIKEREEENVGRVRRRVWTEEVKGSKNATIE